MKQTLAVALVAVAVVLAFALGWVWIVILPVGALVFVAVWLLNVIFHGRAPSSVLRSVPNAELLGPGGPDDPEANRT
jgi:hypothetical protein